MVLIEEGSEEEEEELRASGEVSQASEREDENGEDGEDGEDDAKPEVIGGSPGSPNAPLEDLEPFQGSPVDELDLSSESPSPRSPGAHVADETEVEAEPEDQQPDMREVSHGQVLCQALQLLANAQRSLSLADTSEISVENVERLYAVRRSLREDFEICSSWTIDDRLQALLKLHCQALEDRKRAEEKCEALHPEILMLKRSIAEIIRRMPSSKSPSEPPQEMIPGRPSMIVTERSSRLQALEEAMKQRSLHAEWAKERLLDEDGLLASHLSNAKNVLREAVLEGQRLEDMRDEAATEVFRACRALAQVELLAKRQQKRYQKARELETFLAKSAAAPWRLTALHQAPQTGSMGTTAATAALLDPEAYRLNRENATAQADRHLEAAMELYSVTRDELKQEYQEEVQRQKDAEQTFAAEMQSLKEKLHQRRNGVDSAMASHLAQKEQRLHEAHRELQVELRRIETQERTNQEALRQEVIRAKKRLEQVSATAKQQLDLHLTRVKADCRELLRGTAIQWEKAVLQERKALQEAKLRREKWQKRVDVCRNAFRGHCAKTGVYARTMDASRRAILDSLVPRAKVGDLSDPNG